VSDFQFGDKVKFKYGERQEPLLFIKPLKNDPGWVIVIGEKWAVPEAYKEEEFERA
jgi:hypothetical protein